MKKAESVHEVARRDEAPAAPLPPEPEAKAPPAWELIGAGRYRPRRIRGSNLGRELG